MGGSCQFFCVNATRGVCSATPDVFSCLFVVLDIYVHFGSHRDPTRSGTGAERMAAKKMCFYKTMCAVQHQTSTSAVNKGAEGAAVGPRRQQPHPQTNYPIESAQVCFFVFFATRGGLDDTADRR